MSFFAKDVVEPFGALDYEALAMQQRTNIVSGGDATWHAGDLNFDLGAVGGVATIPTVARIDGAPVAVAAALNVGLIPVSGANPCWVHVLVNKTGPAYAIVQETPGPNPTTKGLVDWTQYAWLYSILTNPGDANTAAIQAAGRIYDKRMVPSTLPNSALMEAMSEGGGPFPHNGGSLTDVTIAGDTTWTVTDYPRGVVKLRKLTIAAGKVLTLGANGCPWKLFVDELVLTDTGSKISLNGQGAQGVVLASAPASVTPGSGGGAVLICARTVTGAAGTISANGSNGVRNTSNAGSSTGGGGLGALAGQGTLATTQIGEIVSPFVGALGNGGRGAASPTTAVGKGGGTGAAIGTPEGSGGSGAGGGGGGDESGVGGAGATGTATRIMAFLALMFGCLGGGAGGGAVNTTGADNVAGGGGGGLIMLIVRILVATPTLTVNAGTGVAASGTPDGAAGLSYLITVAD